MAAFIIELARESDAARIAEMSRDYIEAGLGWHFREDAILAEMRDAETNVVVAREAAGRPPIAFAIMAYRGFEAHLILFAVEPRWRRRGVGSALVRWHIKAARVAGAQAVYVELRAINQAAMSCYGSLGFKELQQLEAYYRERESGIRMALDLRVGAPPG